MKDAGWRIVCRAEQVGAHLVGTTVGSTRVVAFLDGAKPRVLMDRCCHRGLALSRGTLVDRRIVCGYHGWEFDGEGQCVRIPSEPAGRMPGRPYRVPSYPAELGDGYLWAWFGSEAPAPRQARVALGSGGAQGTAVFACDDGLLLEHLFDPSRLSFADLLRLAPVRSGARRWRAAALTGRPVASGFLVTCRYATPAASLQPDYWELELSDGDTIVLRLAMGDEPAVPILYFTVLPATDAGTRLEWQATAMLCARRPDLAEAMSRLLTDDNELLRGVAEASPTRRSADPVWRAMARVFQVFNLPPPEAAGADVLREWQASIPGWE